MSETPNDILKLMSISDGNQFLAALHIQMNGFLDEETVKKVTGLSKTERDHLGKSGEFPEMQTIKGKVNGWRVKDIQHWLNENFNQAKTS